MSEATMPQNFSRLRRYLWPVHGYEMKRLIPMLLMAFFIGFAYNILRNMKDSLLVTAAAGAEVIPFVKVWAMLPMAVLWTAIFIKLSHRFSTEKVFYIVLCSFLGFFMTFAFVLYPLQDYVHPHGLADKLQVILPEGCKGLVAMFRYWTFSLNYAMSELWGAIVLSVLFWGFANEITKVGEAQRFYGILGIGANCSSVAAGQVSCLLSNRLYNPAWPGVDRWHQSLILLTLAVFVAGIIVIFLFRFVNRRIDRTHVQDVPSKQLQKLESKTSMRENFAYLAKSKYLLSIATVVISYNVFINLVEVLWKGQVRNMLPDPNAYNHYMGQVTTITGVIATIFAVLMATFLRKFGWTFTALITPMMLALTSVGFFGCYLMPEESLGVITTLLGTTPIVLITFFGSAQNCFSRACKYSVFDATKEFTFIPLTRDVRVKGKAAIDGVASRAGKSGGSLIYQGLLMIFNTLPKTAPVVAAILAVVLSAWTLAIKALGKQFHQLSNAEPTPRTPASPGITAMASDLGVRQEQAV